MKPVDQTLFGPRKNGAVGNCVSACIASLLELPIADVPYFMGTDADPDDFWKKRVNLWLGPRGLSLVHVKVSRTFSQWPPGLFILMGRSPRGLHAVVAKGGEMRASSLRIIAHDPHPSRTGLKSVDGFAVLVPLDPAKCKRSPSRRSR
jgi:hypothetical protein